MKMKFKRFIACMLVLILISADICAIAEELATIILPKALKVIEDEAFYGNTSIEKVIVPEGVTEIGSKAFADSSLVEIELPESLENIAEDTFGGCDDIVVIAEEGSYAYDWAKDHDYIKAYSPASDFDYVIVDDECRIREYLGDDANVVIPNTIEDCPVTSIIKYAFEECSNLISVDIPDSVTSIGDYAFAGCNSLTEIYMPERLLTIGEGVFSGCSSLVHADIPNNVVSIGQAAFYNCSSLYSIDIPMGVTYIGHNSFYNCSNLKKISFPEGIISIGDSAFEGCNNLSNIDIPESVTAIGAFAFMNCSSLTSITIPNGVSTIEDGTFKGCSNLVSVGIPKSITAMGSSVFSGCSSLTRISIPEGVTAISMFTFYDCSKLISIDIPDSVDFIGDEAFHGCNSLTSIDIPEGVVSIGYKAFFGCSSLTSVDIPENITHLGRSVFYNCINLMRVTVPAFVVSGQSTNESLGAYFDSSVKEVIVANGTEKIGDYAFYLCEGLTSIDIPESVTSIGNNAFYSCTGLTSINIPDSVTFIGDSAFSSCSSLTSIDLSEEVGFIGKSAFRDCNSLASIVIPDGVESIGDYSFSGCSKLKYIGIPDGVTSIGTNAFNQCASLTDIVIPDSVTSIGMDAFLGCDSLTRVTIPSWVISGGDSGSVGTFGYYFDNWYVVEEVIITEGTEEIGNNAFEGCYSLISVDIPDSVTSIGDNAFYGCQALTNMEIPESVDFIGKYAFYWCTNLSSVEIPDGVETIDDYTFGQCYKLMNISIPDSVTYIDDYAFFECFGLTFIDIPESVTYISEYAFVGSELETIYGVGGSCAETFARENDYTFVDKAAIDLDMSFATLDKSIYAPGDTVTISGIRVKNADYVHISGNNLHLKEVNSGESAFDVTVKNSMEYKTLRDITMTIKADTAVEGDFYISVQAYDNDGDSTRINKTSLTYKVSFDAGNAPMLDMSDATLNRGTYAPGDTITISGIKVKNADYVHFSGNNGYLTVKRFSISNTSSYQELGAVELSLSQYAIAGDFYISAQAFDSDGNASAIDQTTLKYTVFIEGEVTPEPDCEHTPSEVSTYNRTLFRVSTEDNNYHIAYADVYICTCAVCGEAYETTVEREVSAQEFVEHDYKDGICQSAGCGYGCAHTDYDDVYNRTISFADNKDGTTHTHVYSAKRVCNSCKTSLGMQTCTVPNEAHNIKNGEIYYITDEDGHQKVTPRVCSCGYEDESVMETKSEHSIVGDMEDIQYYDDGNAHTVIVTIYEVCVCGKRMEIVDISNSISGHVDENRDSVCDKCNGHCDMSNTFYVDPALQHKIVESIMTYSWDYANISQEFIDNLEVHIDNIAFSENVLYYGGIQHSPEYNQEGVMNLLAKHGKLPSSHEQVSTMANTMALLFGQYADYYAAEEFLDLVKRSGCFYTALSSTIFGTFEGRAREFEESFGFPMYYQGLLNYDAILVDFYCYSETHSKENAFGMLDAWKATAWTNYLESRGVGCNIPELSNQPELKITADYVKKCFKEGSVPIIALAGDYDLLDENGKLAYQLERAGHALVVTGVYNDYIVVSSWGHAYLMDIEQVNKAIVGMYTIQYTDAD